MSNQTSIIDPKERLLCSDVEGIEDLVELDLDMRSAMSEALHINSGGVGNVSGDPLDASRIL